jgi:hypothetical protein
MKQAVHQRDIETAAGMLFAYDAFKSSGETSLGILAMAFGKKPEDLDFIWDSCIFRAQALLESVEEVEVLVDRVISTNDKMSSIKQSAVMTAICEMLLLASGANGFEGLDIPELEMSLDKGETDATISTITGGLDPAMLAMVSGYVVDGSYPRENATVDIIAALWMQGYVVGMLGPMMFDEVKGSEFMKRFMINVRKNFIVLPG